MRPLRLRWIFLGSQRRDGLNRKLDPTRAQTVDDPNSKAVPAGFARRGNVHDAAGSCEALREIRAVCREHAGDGIGNNQRRGWRADLICDNLQFGSLAGKTRDRPQEIGALCRVDPRCPNDQMWAIRRANGFFSGELACAVSRERSGRAVLAPRCLALTVEHIVGREGDEWNLWTGP